MAYEVARLLLKTHLREWSCDRSLGASTRVLEVALPTNLRHSDVVYDTLHETRLGTD